MTIQAQLFDSRNLKLEKIPESVVKTQVKESSKGFRRLLKFGRKNNSSGGERHSELDNGSVNGSEADDNGTGTSTDATSEGNIRYVLVHYVEHIYRKLTEHD